MEGIFFSQCLKLCCISPSSSLVDRSVFSEFGLFDEMLPACEDYDFWLRFCAFEEVHFLNEPLLIKNGGHDQQLSKNTGVWTDLELSHWKSFFKIPG